MRARHVRGVRSRARPPKRVVATAQGASGSRLARDADLVAVAIRGAADADEQDEPPGAPAPTAAEAQSKPSSTFGTTGVGSGDHTGPLPFWIGGSDRGRALAAGVASAPAMRLAVARR